MEAIHKRKILLFGASRGAMHTYQILTGMGIEICFFTDNNETKWGSMMEGKKIIPPSELKKLPSEYIIVIASVYYSEIRQQLIEMGIEKNRIILREQLVLSYIEEKYQNNKARTIIFDFSEGFVLSGAVKLAMDIAADVKSRGYPVKIFSAIENKKLNICDEMKKDIELFEFELTHYEEAVEQVLERIEKLLPCTLVINQLAQVYMAAYIAKKRFGSQVKIISLIHADEEKLYGQNALIANSADIFLCVSKEIKFNFISNYNVNPEKVYERQNTMPCEEGFEKQYTELGKPIKIAYAARIEKAQKRAELLPQLIQLLEEKKIDYELHIAGEGSYLKKLTEFVEQNKLSRKIRLYGLVPFEEMKEFWKDKDIFINLSDFEGCAISMLEAMSYGAVPIVTRTSGVDGVVESGINGFVNEREDVEGIVKNIALLNQDRKKLAEYGMKAKKYIGEQYSWKEYIDFIVTLFG